MRSWLPQPMLSLFLCLVWLLLVNAVTPGQIVLGGLLAFALPLFTARFWPDRPCLHRPLILARYILRLFHDIIIANLVVARLILGPTRRLRPAFIRLPLELDSDFAVTVLAHTISLTPGTVSSDISADRKTLLIHALDVADEAELVGRIKSRYETPLKEIFSC